MEFGKYSGYARVAIHRKMAKKGLVFLSFSIYIAPPYYIPPLTSATRSNQLS